MLQLAQVIEQWGSGTAWQGTTYDSWQDTRWSNMLPTVLLICTKSSTPHDQLWFFVM